MGQTLGTFLGLLKHIATAILGKAGHQAMSPNTALVAPLPLPSPMTPVPPLGTH